MILPCCALPTGGCWAGAGAASNAHTPKAATVASRRPERTHESSQSSDMVISGQVRKSVSDLIGAATSDASRAKPA